MNNFNSNWDGVDRKTTNHLSEASQQVIGKYRFTPFMEDTNKEGVAGWTISIQGKGVVAYIAEPKIKSGTSPYKIFRTKGLSFKNFFPGELKMSAYPGKENRVVSEKEIRFVPRQLLKAVAMWMDKYGTKALTEDMETTEMVAEAKAPFPKPFKKGETLFAPNKSGKMVKGELVSYETGKVAGGSFTLKLTGQNESGTIVVGAEALFKANPSKMLKKESNENNESAEVVAKQMMRPVQADAIRRGAANARYLDKAIADFAKDMKALAAVGDPRKNLKAFKAYIPIIHKIEDGMDAMGGGLTWPYDEGTGKTKASFLKGLSPEQKKADQALRSISVWWTQSGLQRITPRSEKIWNDGWNNYRKYMGERVTEETAADETQSLDEVQFITPKVPLTGGSNNSKEKTDYKLYVELKDVVNDVIKKLEQAELMLRSPSKNSNLSILQTVTQTKQKLKIAVK
jgi:hypothetical protein